MEFGVSFFRSYLSVLMIIVTLPEPSKVDDEYIKPLSRGAGERIFYANFEPHKFSYLNITAIGSDLVLEDSECGLTCATTPSCFSFNLGVFYDFMGRVLCELLPSDVFNNSVEFVHSRNHHHYSIPSPCISWPCQNNGTCVAQYEENSYLCVCAEGFTGKHCELDIDECSSSNECDVNADCYNSYGSYSCSCKSGFFGHGKSCQRPDCAEHYNTGERVNGVYRIDPDGSGEFPVYCDHTTSGGGWTLFQKRLEGSVDFYLNWTSYKTGFGSLNGEFWLGLDKIHRLTNSGSYKLRVDLEDMSGNTAYAEYNTFTVDSEATQYQLNVGNYSGNASDSLAYHNGCRFMTKDISSSNCAVYHKGAWWYKNCYHSNLNGVYHHGVYTGSDSIRWRGFLSHSAKRAEMKMRPINF